MQLLQSKYAMVTGGTSGIGKEIAFTFARNGAHVFCVGISKESAETTQKEAEELGIGHLIETLFCDVSKKEQVKTLFDELLERTPHLDILVNNAGITRDKLLLRMTEQEIHDVIDINVKSCFYTSQEALRPMMKSRFGRIINISSIVGITGNAGQTNYAAAKAGMVGFSKSLALEVASRNILVNCIAPGYIETDMTKNLKTEAREKALEAIPLQRLGSVNDIANCALFLASDLSSYMTGQVLVVDGGLTLGY